jgi:predicted GIY-YIG superfamily endonuclease
MNNFCVYILKLSNNQKYVGFTEDIKQRVIEHNKGGCFTTAKYRPVKLVWCCFFTDKIKALEFEKYLKSGSGTEFRRRHF